MGGLCRLRITSKPQLNFGGWFGYALAIQTGEPLLFKGNDFVHTDVLKA
jgi:ribonuclease VapC